MHFIDVLESEYQYSALFTAINLIYEFFFALELIFPLLFNSNIRSGNASDFKRPPETPAAPDRFMHYILRIDQF